MTLLAIVGKRFQDICIESGLIVQGSLSGVLYGKMYNRAVRVHKSIYEGLLRVVWRGFAPWLEANHADMMDLFARMMTQVHELHDELCQEEFDRLLLHEELVMWNEYLEYLRHNNGDLSAFWMSYLDIIGDILLGLIRAAREGDWQLHLSAIRKMIPWCFAYDRLNYARYLPAYFAQMNNLQTDHPAMYQHFCSGGFSVQLTDGNPFGRIPVDQTTELTVNKDTQTTGGTTKFSQKKAAVNRFYLTAEYRSSFLGHLRELTRKNQSALHHTELLKPRIEKDEKAVAAVAEVLDNWTNPFEGMQELLCISTAAAATQEVKCDLLEAHARGERAYTLFKTERLESDPPKRKFHDPLKKSNLKTFSSLSKKKQVTANGKSVILKTDRSLFGRIIVIAQSRSLEMKNVFAHPLGPLPWMLATPDGTPRKTTKSVLGQYLQKLAAPADELPANSAAVIDGMTCVQKVRNNVSTFGEIATSIHAMICKEGSECDRIDDVFDRYDELSIKTSERSTRGQEQGLQQTKLSGNGDRS